MASDRCLCPQVLGPGDAVAALPENGEVRVGTGVIAEEGFLRTVRAGVPRQTKAGKIWLEGRSKRQADAAQSYKFKLHLMPNSKRIECFPLTPE